MNRITEKSACCSRRNFCSGIFSAALAGSLCRQVFGREDRCMFTVAGNEFHFDTGILKGTLHSSGKSLGLLPVSDCKTGKVLTKSMGLFSHYRLLDAGKRYGTAGWEWKSEAKLLGSGDVEVKWTADEVHPFDMLALYRWSDPDALDLTTRVTSKGNLQHFEVFLASYFDGFPATSVYSKKPAEGGKSGFFGADKTDGVWQMFPRDAEAVKVIKDGRWKFPPNPVDWAIRPQFAAPLVVRRDAGSGLAAVLMTRSQDCFAIACPHDGEGHRSVYFSLFGLNLAPGESVEARSRLIICRDVTDEKAVMLYDKFVSQTGNT